MWKLLDEIRRRKPESPIHYVIYAIIAASVILSAIKRFHGCSYWIVVSIVNFLGFEQGILQILTFLVMLVSLLWVTVIFFFTDISSRLKRLEGESSKLSTRSSQTVSVYPNCKHIIIERLDPAPRNWKFYLKCDLGLIKQYGCPQRCTRYEEPQPKTSGRGAVAGAVLGGILFGVVGAVVGAILGDRMEASNLPPAKTELSNKLEECRAKGCSYTFIPVS